MLIKMLLFQLFVTLIRLSQGSWGIKEHAHLFAWNKGTLASILREQGNKTNFGELEQGHFENHFRGTKELDQLFLGNKGT